MTQLRQAEWAVRARQAVTPDGPVPVVVVITDGKISGLLPYDTDPGVPVVPPHGLCLEEVCYPPPGLLAQRALATRRVRPAVGSEPAPG